MIDYTTWLPPYTSAKIMSRAHNKIYALIKSGAIPRPETLRCVICNSSARLYHHHKGYTPPDDVNVVAMCYDCHSKVHNSIILTLAQSNERSGDPDTKKKG